MTWNTVSIEPGSERALALTAEDLAVMHYTGRSITKGYGREKPRPTAPGSRRSS